MEFMNPEQRRRHNIMLIVGYVLVGIAILLITTILVYVVQGYWYSNGQVIQNGLVSLSSAPGSATVSINGVVYKNSTNTSILLPAETYNFKLHRAGYRDWSHSIVVNGNQVENYNYPFLFPVTLKTTTKQNYIGVPALTTQSLNRRWLVVGRPDSLASFDEYDLNNPSKAPIVVTVPAALFAAGSSQTLSAVEWADDNTHLLLKHTYDGNSEYILVDREAPDQSVNLTKTLAVAAQGVELNLNNKKYDRYLVHDGSKQILLRATLNAPTPQTYFEKVLAYRAYGDNTLLYVTYSSTKPGKLDVNLYDGSHSYTIRRDAVGTNYLLDLANYNGDLFVAVAVSGENATYVYDDPVSQITNSQLGVAVPVRVLRLAAPNYLAFSPGAQHVVVENGTKFAVFDAENQRSSTYTVAAGLDNPTAHATWMDEDRLLYISGGKLVVSDFDGTNAQALVPADANYLPALDQNTQFLYVLAARGSDKAHERLTSTALRTAADSNSIFSR